LVRFRHFENDGELAFVFFEDGKGFVGDAEVGMAPGWDFRGVGEAETDLAELL